MEKGRNKYKYLILIIYSFMFMFFIFKMFYYTQYVTRFPDEMAHIAYIAYLEQEQTAIPEFKDMRLFVQINGSDSEINNLNTEKQYQFCNITNYLCHPPLYYQIMRLSGGVQVKNNVIYVDFFKLRVFNMVLASLALLFIFYMGYSRIGKNKNALLHFIYASTIVSIPMLAYSCAGVNNDTLALIAVSIFVFGLLRFVEQKRNFGTYLFISSGVFLAFMSKMTAGLIVFISICIFLIFIMYKEKNLWFLISKKFLATLPIYFATAVYFILIRLQTGSFFITYSTIDPIGYLDSFFYVKVAERTSFNFSQYANYFITGFLRNWTGVVSNVYLVKPVNVISIENVAILAVLFAPFLLIFQIKNVIKKSPAILVFLSVFLGLFSTMAIQLLRGYHEYATVSGYLGGYQARYYLCGISAIVFAIVYLLKGFFDKIEGDTQSLNTYTEQTIRAKKFIKFKKISVTIGCLLFVAILFYEDFIYFLLYFKNYG